MKTALLVTLLASIVALLVFADSWRQRKKIESAFQGRIPLSPEGFYESFFRDQGIPFEVVAGVRQVLEEQLGIDLSRLQSSDDFSTNLSFLLEFDSLADVEIICSLEERFGIKISDDEAAAAHTVSDLILLVNSKVAAGVAA